VTAIQPVESGTVQLPTGQLLDLLLMLFPHLPRKKIRTHLYRKYRDVNKPIRLENGLEIVYSGQPGGAGKHHYWRVDATEATEKDWAAFEAFQKKRFGIVPSLGEDLLGQNTRSQPERNQGKNAKIEWKGLFFRSPIEKAIAQALDRAGMTFFPNARGRTSFGDNRVVLEVDFLVLYRGKTLIVELDGKQHDKHRLKDYRRDRAFLRQGFPCIRFAASECRADADAVVAEILAVFDGF
jgi:hypothetical protein